MYQSMENDVIQQMAATLIKKEIKNPQMSGHMLQENNIDSMTQECFPFNCNFKPDPDHDIGKKYISIW